MKVKCNNNVIFSTSKLIIFIVVLKGTSISS